MIMFSLLVTDYWTDHSRLLYFVVLSQFSSNYDVQNSFYCGRNLEYRRYFKDNKKAFIKHVFQFSILLKYHIYLFLHSKSI